MKILILNAGSSSHKLCLYSIERTLPKIPPVPAWEAQIDWYPQKNEAIFEVETEQGNKLKGKINSPSKRDTLFHVLSTLWQDTTQAIHSPNEIDAVGHRVVHGGQAYQSSVVVTPDVKAKITSLSSLAPTHNLANLAGIELMEQILGDAPQVAVFDTTFHRHIPDFAATYPGPYDWLKMGIRRYGFHGISHQYCAQRAAQLLNRDLNELSMIICHLGNGGSLTAVKNGHSINTTMGFTPLDGLMMGTRSGAVDPGILIYLMRQGYSADQLDHLLNKESGLKGISGISHDLREIEQAVFQGNERAKLAQDIFLHRLYSCLGEMLMSLSRVDTIIFTAGIGEHAAWVRAKTCEALAFLGLRLDPAMNKNSPVDLDIATEESKVRVLVIHTQEHWEIAKETWHCVN